MATFLVRAFDLEEAPSAGFVDTEESVHSANIDALAAAGITAGCKTDPLSYCPDKPVTRAQMATFLHRAIGTSDRAILAALYHATGGPKWSARTKWLSNTPIGQWFGVTTNRDGYVNLLDLRGNGLKGFIPPVLGNLTHLSDLYAAGQIPEYHQVVDTIIAWGEEILAYHSSRRASNGPLEGTNNLLQVLRRVAHGFTNPDNYAARGILVTLILVGCARRGRV